MVDLHKYRGINQYGHAYKIMLQNDSHTPSSVDRILFNNMIRLCMITATTLYTKYTDTRSNYKRGSRPKLELVVKKATKHCALDEEKINAISMFTSSLTKNVSDDIDKTKVSGTEEEIIASGSDWCIDLARVGCALFQVAGFPSRLVYLFNTEKAYSGHAITEVHRDNSWGAVDPTTNVVYRLPSGKPATTLELMNDSSLVVSHNRGKSTPYTIPEQFLAAGISNYYVWLSKKYNYSISAR